MGSLLERKRPGKMDTGDPGKGMKRQAVVSLSEAHILPVTLLEKDTHPGMGRSVAWVGGLPGTLLAGYCKPRGISDCSHM